MSRATPAPSPTPSSSPTCAARQRAEGLGVSKGDRVNIYLGWSPSCRWRCSPARASAPRTRSCSAASRPTRCATASRTPRPRCSSPATARGGAGSVVPLKETADEAVAECPTIEKVLVLRRTGQDVDDRRARRVVARPRGRSSAELRARAAWTPRTCSTCCTPPAPRQAQGHHAHDRWLPHAGGWTHRHVFDLHPDTDVYWCTADIGWVTGHSYIVYGPLTNGATSVIYEGTPDHPDKDRLWQIVERYRVTILYTAPTAIRTFMKWGPEYPEAPRPVVAAPARHRRRADQPRGVGLVLAPHRRRALPGRRHLVADRDRRHHDRPAPRRHHAEARQRHRTRSRRSAPTSSTTPARRSASPAAGTSC